jgi:hypothetical protein
MVELPRLWSKKRGSRLLMQYTAGAVGEALYYAVLFLLGVLALSIAVARAFSVDDLSQLRIGYGFWLTLIASLSLIGLGGGNLAYRILRISASGERRAALVGRAEQLAVGGRPALPLGTLPCVPVPASLIDSPGTHLAYRLPEIESPSRALGAGAILALAWNGLWLVLAVVACEQWLTGRRQWLLLIVLVPLGAIAWRAARHFLELLRQHAGVGPTIVEVSDLPLVGGRQYRGYLSQLGRLRLKSLTVALTCEEEATYRQGTDVRVERAQVFETVLWNGSRLSIDPGTPFEQEFALAIPAGVMHSFQSPHHAVRWLIVVRAESRGWPSFCRSFPVVVHPPVAPEAASR